MGSRFKCAPTAGRLGFILFVATAFASPSPPSPGQQASMTPDQVNTAGWDKAWTNLVNDAEQTFTPSLPRLLGVEVELVVGNAGATSGGTTFGWKYVVGGYEKGAATFNGKPLLPQARSTFLFRTFARNK